MPKEIFDQIESLNQTAPQIVGNVAQAVLGIYAPSLFGKSAILLKNKPIVSALLTGGLKGSEMGLGFGTAQALSSGTKDPVEIAKIISTNVATMGVLGMITSGIIPVSKELKNKVVNIQKKLEQDFIKQGYSSQEAKLLAQKGGYIGGVPDKKQKVKVYPTAERIKEAGATPEQITLMAMESGKTSGQAREEVLRVFPELKQEAPVSPKTAQIGEESMGVRKELQSLSKTSQSISKAKAEGQSFDDYHTSLLSERISPSKRIVEPSLPKSGLETKVSPSLTRILEPAGASKSTRYVAPSHLYSLDDPFIYTDYSKVSRLMQANQSAFTDDVAKATWLQPDVRVKSKASFEGKVERYRIAGKDPATIADNLAGRIVVEESEITKQLSNIQKNFNVVEVQDFFKTPTEFGYKGINAKIKLPNEQLVELQIHTPESLVSANRIHKLYEKWRNLDVENLTPNQLKEMVADISESQKLATRSEAPVSPKTAPIYKSRN